MKHTLTLVAGISMLMTFSHLARAQKVPEFHLDLRFTDTLVDQRIKARDTVIGGKTVTVNDTTYNRDTIMVTGRSFGYDPTATDGYDAGFGEDQVYPGGPYGSNLYFDYPVGIEQTRTDIRQKPAGATFVLTYKMHSSFVNYPKLLWGSILWNRAQIPEAVKAITVALASDPNHILFDMLKQSSFTISPADQGQVSDGPYLVTLYYGAPPSSVAPGSSGSGLIASASAYPNPISESGKLSLVLNDAARIHVLGYDAAGRLCLDNTQAGTVGENLLSLSDLSATVGAVMLHIEATSGTRNETKNVVVVRE